MEPRNDNNILTEQYVLVDYDGEYSAVGPFANIREAKAFASGIDFAVNEDMRILGFVLREQLLVEASIVAPAYLPAKK